MENTTKKKRVAIVGTAGIPSRYGGFETLAHHLVNQLNDTYEFRIYASKKLYAKHERVKYFNKARIHYLPFSANGITSVLYDIVSMLHAIFCSDTILILGVSGGLFVPFLRIFTRKKIVVNIDGLEWRRDKWSKPAKIFLKLSERVAVRFAHADITDNLAIKRYTSKYYNTCSHYIAYGADHCSKISLSKEDFTKYPFARGPYAFKVARIEPENNVKMILEAFKKIKNKKLVMVGNWNNSDFGINLRSAYKGCPNIFMLDPIYDQIELDKLRSNCYVYVHGHSAGGTNPSLVEAMFLKLPILAFDVSFNRYTTHEEAYFFSSEQELVKQLNEIALSEFVKTASRLKKIAANFYTWSFIAGQYKNLFESFEYGFTRQKTKLKLSKDEITILNQKGYAHMTNVKPFYK